MHVSTGSEHCTPHVCESIISRGNLDEIYDLNRGIHGQTADTVGQSNYNN
jgi:hypothetical protein